MQRPSAVPRSNRRHPGHSANDSFRLLIENNQRYAIFVLDSTGQIESWNAAAQRIYHFNADEIIGRNFRVLYSVADVNSERPRPTYGRLT